MSKKINFLLTNSFVLLLMLTWSLSCDTLWAAPVNNSAATSLPRFGAYRPSGKSPYNPRSAKSKGTQLNMNGPLKVIKGGPEFWGVIEYSEAWENTYENEAEWPVGVYSFLASNPGNMSELLITGQNGPNGGGVFFDNSFHYVNYYVMYETVVTTYTYDYNTTTWQQNGYSQYGSDASIVGNDLTYDPSTGNVYGFFYNPLSMEEPMRFGTISYTQYGAEVTTISTLPSDFICIAANSEGQLYGIDCEGLLYKINKTDGTLDVIDYTGVRPSTFRQSATFDPNTGKLYWAAFREDYTSGLYEINLENGLATLITDFPDNMEVSCLHIPVSDTADGAPAEVTDFSVEFKGGSLTGTASFTAPTETFSGEALSGELKYYILAGTDTIKKGETQPGENINTEITVAQNGETEFTLRTRNAAGFSRASDPIKLYVGIDVPNPPTNVVLTVDDSGKMNLTWTAPVAGVHGGYFDSQSLVYDVVRYPGQVTVATNLTDCAFRENLPEGSLAAYYYTVTARIGDVSSEAAESNRQIAGDAFTVPFNDDFSSDDTYDLYTVIDANGDGTTWNPSMNAFSYFYSFINSADDWVITPPIKLQTGYTYKFSFSIRAGLPYGTEKFATAYGQGTDPSAYTELSPVQELSGSNYTTFEKTFEVATDGEYRFGVHALSDVNQNGLYVTDFSVTAESLSSAPDSVTNVQIIPAELGVLKATIRFNAPSVDIDNNKLEQLTKVEIYRDGENLLTTFENPKAGELLEYVDNAPVNGMNHYMFVGYNDNGRGVEATDSAYIGIDRPMSPQNVVLIDNGQGGITLTWEAPGNEGANGYYVNPDNLTYTVYDPEGNVMAEEITDTQYSMTYNLELYTSVIYFNVTASNIGGESQAAISSYLVTGRPATLPYHESFPNGGTTQTFWWSTARNDYNAFSFSPEMEYSYDHDSGSAKWAGNEENDYADLFSGKITAEGVENPALFFHYHATPGAGIRFSVNAILNDGSTVTLSEYDFQDITGETGWRDAIIYLDDKLKSAKYFVLNFHAESDGDYSEALYIDDITLRNVARHDLAVTLQSPTSVTAGQQINAQATITNIGANNAENFTVSLWADNKLAAQKEVGNLEVNEETTITLTYSPSISESKTVPMYATVDYAADENTNDNTSEILDIEVAAPAFPTVGDLVAIRTNEGAELTWTAIESGKNTVKETFDSYDPWLTSGFGEWNVFDGDKMNTNAYTSMWYPHIGEQFAYIVFNNRYAVMDISQEPVFTPCSGDQCLAAFATVHDYSEEIETDDWLISPELSGEAQTISFYIKSLTDYQEDYYVYYSTESADVADLQKNLISFEKWEAGSTWTQKSYDVPDGAKYFAIRYTSNLSGILIDDFVYEGKPLTVVGYNIYRDGELIATTETNKFIDTEFRNDCTYAVTVVYAQGESAFSNTVSMSAGISDVISDERPANVYSVSGILLRSNATSLDGLPRGVYIVGGVKVVKTNNN